jgi:hypothetical protein
VTTALDESERRALRQKARTATLEGLRALGGEARRKAIDDWTLAHGAFTSRELAAPPPERAPDKYTSLVEHELAWTLTDLKRDGLVEKPKWGTWRLTGPALTATAKPVTESVGAERLAELRAMPHRQYLRTPEWRRTKAAALLRAGNACSLDVTHTEGLEVHHRTYERLGAELSSDLAVLCRSCHQLHHKEYGRPRRKRPAKPAMRRKPSLLRRLLASSLPFAVLSLVLLLTALPAAAVTGRAGYSTKHRQQRGSHDRLRQALARASIIGGVAAETGTLPYLAYIIDETGFEEFETCTGTVLSPNVVLTAGHCGENEETGVLDNPADYAVITGNVEWTVPAADKQVSGVNKIVVYPGYLRSVALGDAALLVLSTPTTAPAISLATSPSDAGIIEAGRVGALAGWGDTFFAQEEPTERLRWADTVIQRPAYCEANAPTFFPSEELCVINPPDDETGACHGDSGGPLLSVAPSGSGLVETGVISHGNDECSTTQPTVVTRTDFLASWANDWVAAEKPPAPPPAPKPAPAPTPAPAPVKPPAAAPFIPPNIPGFYVTPHSKRGQKITAHVAEDGTHLVGLTAKMTVNCQHGYTYKLDSSWLSYSDTVLITNHVVTATLETEESRYAKAGDVGLHLQFNDSGALEGRLRAHIRTRNSRAGLCSGTLRFKASE